MATYIAFLHKEADGDFGVSFPDFPGCVTAGASYGVARVLALEVLQFHVDGLAAAGEELPSPSTFDEIMEERDNQEATAFLVPVRIGAVHSPRPG